MLLNETVWLAGVAALVTPCTYYYLGFNAEALKVRPGIFRDKKEISGKFKLVPGFPVKNLGNSGISRPGISLH